MKKTYMTPSQKIAELELENMIAQSGEPTFHNEEGDGEQLVKEQNSIFGGKGNLWDDEW